MKHKPLKCPCGFETSALRALVKHQTMAHGVGERIEVPAARDPVLEYDEDANKLADL